MELIVIDENKLKIMLSAPDMLHYELRAERMDYADEDTQRAFRHIFHDARDQIGFETTGERLLVQLYTSREGGCEIFVTKLGECSVGDPTMPACTAAGENALLDRLRGEPALREEAVMEHAHHSMPDSWNTTEGVDPSLTQPDEAVSATDRHVWAFSFDGLDTLLRVCHRLRDRGYDGQSRAYIEERTGSVFLLVSLPGTGFRLPLWAAFLSEYGQEVTDTEGLCLYLSEHGRPLCATGAVEVLGQL